MNYARPLATLALLAALTACGSDSEPAAAPTSPAPAATSAAPSPTPDVNRRGCAAISKLHSADSNPTAYRDAGALAAESTVPGIRQAGIDLINAANAADADPGVQANIALDRAILDLADACGTVYGDGPW